MKQVVKAKQTKVAPRATLLLPGTSVDGKDPVMGYFSKLCSKKAGITWTRWVSTWPLVLATFRPLSRGLVPASTLTALLSAEWNNHQAVTSGDVSLLARRTQPFRISTAFSLRDWRVAHFLQEAAWLSFDVTIRYPSSTQNIGDVEIRVVHRSFSCHSVA